ncbi:MAG TPA: SprT family zinc-dependent metalloprotease [bacterium]|jgi:predicted metal-dependent hydrolase|nr:SprT family zinc-dependent metalloprotease [bacterium]
MLQLGLFNFFKPAPKPRAAAPSRSREPYALDCDGLVATVRRKPIRTLRMMVKPPDGDLQVSAPLRVADREIRAFVLSRRDWVLRQRGRLAAETAPPAPDYVDGESLPLLGRTVTLRVLERGSVAKADWVGDQTLLLRAPAAATRARREAAVTRWYMRELLKAAQALLPQRQAAMGVEASALKVRAMRSRWGSCNTRSKAITLALELARRPPEALEYILVHELAHLHVRSHGKRFKGILDKQLPDWRARRKQLNSRGILD